VSASERAADPGREIGGEHWHYYVFNLQRTVVILELADIRIQPGKQAEFELALQRGLDTVIARAQGFQGYTVQKGVESPERYLLMIRWETLENHTVDFRGSAAFQDWRAIVGPFFAGAPMVEHFTPLSAS